MKFWLVVLLSALFSVWTADASSSPHQKFGSFKNPRLSQAKKRAPKQSFKLPDGLQKRASRFATPQAARENHSRVPFSCSMCTQLVSDLRTAFAVDGRGIPEVPFDVGESYAGLLPVSDAADETRKLFFWSVIATPCGAFAAL